MITVCTLVRLLKTPNGFTSGKREGGQRPTERSVFRFSFVKLANFRANILGEQGYFMQSFVRSAGSVEKMLQWRSTTP